MPAFWIAILVAGAAALAETADAAAGAAPTSSAATAPPREPSWTAVSPSTGDAAAAARSGRELLSAVREALPRLARPDGDQVEAAARELLLLLHELRQDTDLAPSQRSAYQAKVRSRLQSLGDQIARQIAEDLRQAKPQAPERLREPGPVLDQQLGGGRPVRPPAQVGGNLPVVPGDLPSDDYGQHLVEVIRRTIAPASWDVNGGLGAVNYWRPGRALVIRQTDGVHEEVGEVLRQLERAGR